MLFALFPLIGEPKDIRLIEAGRRLDMWHLVLSSLVLLAALPVAAQTPAPPRSLEFAVTNEAGTTAYDASSWALSWMLKKSKAHGDAGATVTKTTANGGITVSSGALGRDRRRGFLHHGSLDVASTRHVLHAVRHWLVKNVVSPAWQV